MGVQDADTKLSNMFRELSVKTGLLAAVAVTAAAASVAIERVLMHVIDHQPQWQVDIPKLNKAQMELEGAGIEVIRRDGKQMKCCKDAGRD